MFQNNEQWIYENGSRHLIQSYIEGYGCTNQYIRERINLELGLDWLIDYRNSAIIEERFSPSLEALIKASKLKYQGYVDVKIKWLKCFKNYEHKEIILINIYDKNVFLIINRKGEDE